ncbi:MAG: hypothetical protein Q4C54_07470 [Clostridia bacterium]|nr:hypothetical protein [Clostridia bacterium]
MTISKETELRVSPSRKVRVQHLTGDFFQWCIQYRGNGHYFHSFEAVCAYIEGRWSKMVLEEADFL